MAYNIGSQCMLRAVKTMTNAWLLVTYCMRWGQGDWMRDQHGEGPQKVGNIARKQQQYIL